MRHRFNPHKRVNDYQRFSMLTVLPLMSMSCTLGNSSSLYTADEDHFCRYYNPLSAKKDILKNFLCIWWWQNVMVKTCLSQKIIKNRNLIQAMKNSVYPKVLKRKLSESRIFPKAEFVRIFRECSEVWIEDVDWRCGLKTRHDNRELRWSNTYSVFRKAEFVRIFTKCSVAWIKHTTR